MKMTKFRWIVLLILFTETAGAIDVRLQRSIVLQPLEAKIGVLVSFVINKEGSILALDFKTSDIKCFDSEGRWVKTFGRKGTGPGELGMPVFCSYLHPHFAVMDAGRRKIILFEIKDNFNLIFIKEIPCPSLGSDLKISRENNLLIAGYAADANGNSYELFSQSWTADNRRLLLPSPQKYGMRSQSEFHRLYREKDDYRAIGLRNYVEALDDDIYYVWEGALRNFHLKTDGRLVKTFGQATDNFIKPVAGKALKEAYRNRDGVAMEKERRKSSQIIGLFADANFIGLLYATFNRTKETGTVYLQVYSKDGELLEENALMTESEEEIWAVRPAVYLRDRKELYLLTDRMTPGLNESYHLHVFKIDGPQEH